MSKISTALRAAALGPAPESRGWCNEFAMDWGVDWPSGAVKVVSKYSDGCSGRGLLFGLTEHECRMFLLFVAEAEE